MTFSESGGSAEVTGVLKVQVGCLPSTCFGFSFLPFPKNGLFFLHFETSECSLLLLKDTSKKHHLISTE